MLKFLFNSIVFCSVYVHSYAYAVESWVWVDGQSGLKSMAQSKDKAQNKKQAQHCQSNRKQLLQAIQKSLTDILRIRVIYPKQDQGCSTLSCAQTRMKVAGSSQAILLDSICLTQSQVFIVTSLNQEGEQLKVQKTLSLMAKHKASRSRRSNVKGKKKSPRQRLSHDDLSRSIQNLAYQLSQKLIQGPKVKQKVISTSEHYYSTQMAWHLLSPAQDKAQGFALGLEYAYFQSKKYSEYVIGAEYQHLQGQRWASRNWGLYVGYRKILQSRALAPIIGLGIQVTYEQQQRLFIKQQNYQQDLLRAELWQRYSKIFIALSPYLETGFYWRGRKLQPHLLLRAYLMSLFPFNAYQGTVSIIGGLRW
jgi:hypothetical protein